jgi:hypothetical protein
MPSAPILEQYLSIDTDFDPPCAMNNLMFLFDCIKYWHDKQHEWNKDFFPRQFWKK